MPVQDTSLEVYFVKVLPRLAEKQATVYRVLQDATSRGFDMTNREIAALLKWDINRVTPRVLELREKGLVVLSCRRRCGVTGNMAYAWKTVRR